MRKLWSISTTVRNPERLRDFLKVLKMIEGEPFNAENQIKYQILLIQNRFYKPTHIPSEFIPLWDNPTKNISYELAEKIFYLQNYQDPAMRGRQSVNPLNKLGFAVARESLGKIEITELGNNFISGKYDIGFTFFKSLLKLQFPNPWSKDFQEGFDVIPFIATLHLIDRVNQKFSEKGLTQTEFSLFVPSLVNYQQIDEYVEKIALYRKSTDKKQFLYEFAKDFYQTLPSEKQLKNFYEYGDNIMRYFRLTRFFCVSTSSFGAEWRIDIEPNRKIEVEQILRQFSGKALDFQNEKDYLQYIRDINLPILPNKQAENIKKIIEGVLTGLLQMQKNHQIQLNEEEKAILSISYESFSQSELENLLEKLRRTLTKFSTIIQKKKLINNVNEIQEIISLLQDSKKLRKIEAYQFEKLLADGLKIINDEIEIKPNYPVDDVGEPISHAVGNQADIECFYQNFNAICEVTLDTSLYQWVRETQPVMRHLRDFEKKYKDKNCYCLFIAPKIHQDTLYHFWTSIKYGYDGAKQKIIPLNTQQFAVILETLQKIVVNTGKRITHFEVEKLYQNIVEICQILEGHSNWQSQIENVVIEWKNQILSDYGVK
ncbi:AlwI family type II restriction endonuclease [Raineya sp.]